MTSPCWVALQLKTWNGSPGPCARLLVRRASICRHAQVPTSATLRLAAGIEPSGPTSRIRQSRQTPAGARRRTSLDFLLTRPGPRARAPPIGNSAQALATTRFLRAVAPLAVVAALVLGGVLLSTPKASGANGYIYVSLPTWLGNCPGGGSVKYLQVSSFSPGEPVVHRPRLDCRRRRRRAKACQKQRPRR